MTDHIPTLHDQGIWTMNIPVVTDSVQNPLKHYVLHFSHKSTILHIHQLNLAIPDHSYGLR